MDEIVILQDKIRLVLPYLIQNKIESCAQLITDITQNSMSVLSDLIQKTVELKQYGIEVPYKEIARRITVMSQNYESMDFVALADSYEYEILDALEYYKQIIINLGRS